MKVSSIFVEPFVDKGLGNSAYLVGSRETKTAALVDPLRDVDRYLATAERLGVTLTHVLDTHLHNDFISGARELAAQVGARVGASAEAGLGFEHQPLAEGDQIPFGDVAIRVLHTPGHTPEHIAFLATEADAPVALFSGGALMVGGAARTDLLGQDLAEPLARDLYHTLHHTLLALPDHVSVYPTHGAGSFCAVPASSDRTTTIGRERTRNALAFPQTEDEFVARALSGLPSYPVYYKEMRPINRRGPDVLGGVPELKPLTPREVHHYVELGAAVLDIRPRRFFAAGHIPGAYGIQSDAPLVTWAGWLIPFGTPLMLLSESPADHEFAVRQLIRIGYDRLLGYLAGGMEAWAAADMPIATVNAISTAELWERLRGGERLAVLDVRQDSEWQAGHIPGAIHIENGRLPYDDLPLPTDRPIAVQCARGSRSMAAISVLSRRGYRDLLQVEGGIGAWEEAGFEVERG